MEYNFPINIFLILHKNVFTSKRNNKTEICINKKGIVTCITNDYNTSDILMIRAIRG